MLASSLRVPGRTSRRGSRASAGTPPPIRFADLFPGAYQVLQTDLGLSIGPVPAATGTTPPAGSLSGMLTRDNATPLWFKPTTPGPIGGGAVFSAFADGLGVTPFQTGITPAPGVPQALTGPATGLSMAWAAGTAAADNLWRATCSGLADQSGNGVDASFATPANQPIVTSGVNGFAAIANPIGDARFLASALAIPAPATTPTMLVLLFRQLSWISNRRIVGDTGVNHCGIVQSPTANNLQQYDGGGGNIAALALNTWVMGELVWQNATTDYMRLGAAAPITGISSGSSGPGTGRYIFTTAGIAGFAAEAELLAIIYTPVIASTAAFRAAVTTKYAGLVAA